MAKSSLRTAGYFCISVGVVTVIGALCGVIWDGDIYWAILDGCLFGTAYAFVYAVLYYYPGKAMSTMGLVIATVAGALFGQVWMAIYAVVWLSMRGEGPSITSNYVKVLAICIGIGAFKGAIAGAISGGLFVYGHWLSGTSKKEATTQPVTVWPNRRVD
jgi:hypothetical protein